MTNSQTLLFVVVVQQAFFGLLWLGAGALRVSRRAAAHWGIAAMAFALAMGLILARDQTSPWWSIFGGNLVMLLASMAARRGVLTFIAGPMRDLEQGLVLGAAALVVGYGVADDSNFVIVVMGASLAQAWCMWRVAGELAAHLKPEFGRAAIACAVPPAILGILWFARGALAPVIPRTVAQSVTTDNTANLTLVLASLLLGMVINSSLIALVVARLIRKLQHASDHDLLTGVLNRRGMADRLAAEEGRLRRQSSHYALLSVDLDHFKNINDRYGHAAGDVVLAAVARAFTGAVRSVDSVARTGGEEFSVLLPDADGAGAEQTAQRLKAALDELSFPAVDPALRVTASMGLACSTGDEPLSALQRRLDVALYAAKAEGRNRVVHAASPQTPGRP
jgi:diguanylate cyclase (GGDEF)-like protein